VGLNSLKSLNLTNVYPNNNKNKNNKKKNNNNNKVKSKPLELFELAGKNSKHWSNEKGPSSTTKIVQQNNSERSKAMHLDTNIFVIVSPICSTC
jgi:hypothetical protein